MHLKTSPSSLTLRGALALALLSPQAAGAAPDPGRAAGRAAHQPPPLLGRDDAPPLLARDEGPPPLLGSTSPAPATGPAAGATEAAAPGKPAAACPGAQEALASTSAGKYSEAARLYEQCARAGADAGLWKKAGMARYSARQYAHTIQALDAALRVGGDDPQIAAILADARRQAVTVRFAVALAPGARAPARLRVTPRGAAAGDVLDVAWAPAATASDVWLDPGEWSAEVALVGGGTVGPQDLRAARDAGAPQTVLFRVEAAAVATPPPGAPAPIEVELSLGPAGALKRGATLRWSGRAGGTQETVRTSTTRWLLAPGAWDLRVEAPRFVAQTRALELRAGEPARVALELARTRQDRARIGLSVATGAVALGLLVGGVALAVRGRRDYRGVMAELDGSGSPASRAALATAMPAIRDHSNGTMLATSALGAGLAAVSVAADVGDKLLGVEAGIGGVLIVAGVAWLVPAKRQYADAPAEGESNPDRDFLDEHRRPELAAASLIGLGAGLAAGAALALVTRAALRRGERSDERRARIPRVVGLGLRGNF